MAGFELSADVGQMYSYDGKSTSDVIYCYSFAGFGGVTLTADMVLTTPVQTPPTPTLAAGKYAAAGPTGKPTMTCAALIESATWNGKASDGVVVSMWVTQDNWGILWGKLQTALVDTTITAFSFWAGKYDNNTKLYFDWCYQNSPVLTMNGQLSEKGRNRDPFAVVANEGQTFAKGSPSLYNFQFEIVSAGNYQGTFQLAASKSIKGAHAWGSKQTGTASTTLPAPTDS
jgi:hypothetical protein